MFALKLFFRNFFYKNRIFAKKGLCIIQPDTAFSMKKTTIKISGKNNCLKIGKGCRIQNCEIRLKGSDNEIVIGDDVTFKSGKIYLIGGVGQKIVIGSETTVEGAYLLTDENASIFIGNDCMLATDILIRTGDKHSVVDVKTGGRINPAADVVLGDHVWVGRSVHMLKGACVPSNSIVGARSLVTGRFEEENIVLAGMPAKVVKREVNWLRELV